MAVALTACSFAGGFSVSAASTGMSPVDTNSNLRVADISHWNNVNNWDTAASNLDAIYIKATGGMTITDANFINNAESSESVHLKYGFYHYLYPYADITVDKQQADRFYDSIKDYNYECIPVLDIEETNEADNMSPLSKAQITNAVKAFIDEFKSISGQDIMIYSSTNFINSYLDSSLSTYKLWISYPDGASPKDTNVWHQWTMWQYAGDGVGFPKGSVAGVDGVVDLNRASNGIFLTNSGSGSGTGSGDAYSLVVDKNYTAGSKSFSATASLDGGSMMMVTTLSTGEQVFSYQPLTAAPQTFTISVNDKAVSTAVYLVKGPFTTGSGVPVTYGLTQYVKAN